MLQKYGFLPQLQVTTERLSRATTIIRYDALAVDIPPSPPGGPVPPGARKVVVTRIYGDGPAEPPSVISDASQISRLTQVADTLPVNEALQGGVVDCAAEVATTLTDITFAFAYGGSTPGVVLTEDVFCSGGRGGAVTVKGAGATLPVFYDPGFRLAAAAGLSLLH